MGDPVGPNAEWPTKRVVEQRIRNRLIEYFEFASSFTAQLRYEAAAPIVHVPYEIINQWEDWTLGLDLWLDEAQVYTAEEKEALRRFQVVWDRAADDLADDYPALRQVQAMPAWKELRQEAELALAVFAHRGRLPEDHERWP
ncbi:hypothetical protein [Occultella kanbiaonis]|uniref:hypothetical protein n=1 Tax=Occultella kanbiaonis TaxID=2675754 RepID=UPI0012B837AE|nr:hypothetical protein [Occultella kanbiaonis]